MALRITGRARHETPRCGTAACSCPEKRPAHEGQILQARAAGEGIFLGCGRSYVQPGLSPAVFQRKQGFAAGSRRRNTGRNDGSLAGIATRSWTFELAVKVTSWKKTAKSSRNLAFCSVQACVSPVSRKSGGFTGRSCRWIPKDVRFPAAPLAALSQFVRGHASAARARTGRFRPVRRGGHFGWRQRRESRAIWRGANAPA